MSSMSSFHGWQFIASRVDTRTIDQNARQAPSFKAGKESAETLGVCSAGKAVSCCSMYSGHS